MTSLESKNLTRLTLLSLVASMLSFSFSAGADTGSPIFVTAASVSAKPSGFDKAANASIKIGSFGGECSAVMISPQGYFLTAFHCISKWLPKLELATKVAIPGVKAADSDKYFAYGIDREKIKSGASFYYFGTSAERMGTAMADGTYLLPPGNNIRLVATGADGFIDSAVFNDIADQYPQGLYDMLEKGFTGVAAEGDFALLQLPTVIDGAIVGDLRCVSLSSAPLQPGSMVWSLGYPHYKRQDGTTGDGIAQMYSKSTVVNGTQELSILKGVDDDDRANFDLFFAREGTFYSSLDAEHGSSGSGVFDSSGNLAGIIYGIQRQSTSEYDPGSTQAISIQTIVKRLQAVMDPAEFKVATSCPSPAAQAQ